MTRNSILNRLTLLVFAAALLGLPARPLHAGPGLRTGPTKAEDFQPAAPQGFGDRQNSWAWSMQWWNGSLYVGTNRAWHCVEMASLAASLPSLVEYDPDNDPDTYCEADPTDLPLQAEIWRWTPRTGQWQRVYQAPRDVALVAPPGKLVARDIGYRGMTVFTEPDGTQALYVTGVSPQAAGLQTMAPVPPRILRSTDGVNFAPLPQEPGTVLGSLRYSVLRNPTGYNGRLYLTAGTIQGSGFMLESADPAQGNDSFRIATAPGVTVSSLAEFNGYLYLGLRDVVDGYAVAKTDASGDPPYTLDRVIQSGGYLSTTKNSEVLSMVVFKDHLYVGGNGVASASLAPGAMAELVRIAPDDSWDLLVGFPRRAPDGLKTPISGYQAGFGNAFNAHMWRMVVYNDRLYVGTFDSSTVQRFNPKYGDYARDYLGFDLYYSEDGVTFAPISTDGLGDPFNFGVRSFAATPYGLFLGTTNYYYGLQIWRSTLGATATESGAGFSFLPVMR